ncbi:fasciclin domain-containing protein [Sphingomonas sp. SM33]|uniref:Fasciclin domain-containing protein n=1 Tax=Sphingomonas telluris TaxID=2907998 RepID=A0ABS9VQJ8_9SPHN|nr:fasciclin domain-containing protein [Sphingomonas telluris]MCH8616794.1 fasciclin domain-containing protein [Sphingomonas telluris]
MTSRLFAAAAIAAALAASGCNKSDNANSTPAQPAEAAKKAGNQTIADALDKNGRFYQAAHAAGLDSTLAGPGPYTVLVPKDEAFASVQGALAEPAKPENRAELTRVLTYHILPGTVLIDDLGKAVDNGKGKALVQTMNGQTLTATKEGGKVVLTDTSGGKATIVEGDQQRSNGVVQYVDAVLAPSADKGAAKK